ncbi:MAG: hypothetical protein OEW75_06860 [Cyclobacteriaceae bacterium]|nr:hypothetical protein [Cyclobacteriaceae bacterium]
MKKNSLIVVSGIIICLFLLYLIFESFTNFQLFAGRFHPLIIHFPIGILFLGFTLELLSQKRKHHSIQPILPLILLFGSITAIISVVLGLFLSWEGGYSDDGIFLHKWMGIFTGLFSFILYLINAKVNRKSYLLGYTLLVILLAITGHKGGNLTYGDDFLLENLPPGVTEIFNIENKANVKRKLIENLPEALIYEDIISPIFDSKCVSCHNSRKLKGELRLDNPEGIMKGGENGEVIIPEDHTKSSLYKLVTLPGEDEDHMPPEGRDPLTDSEISLIKWWINQGKLFNTTVADVTITEEVKDKLFKLTTASQTTWDKLILKKIPDPNPEIIAEMKKKGVIIKKISEEANYLEINYSLFKDEFSNADLTDLLQIKEYIVWLDIGGRKEIDDSSVKIITQFPNLIKLHLENTKITDNAILLLTELPLLEYLNLYGTNISNNAVQHLKNFRNLKALYIWKTQITADGILDLNKLTNVEIAAGEELLMDNNQNE